MIVSFFKNVLGNYLIGGERATLMKQNI